MQFFFMSAVAFFVGMLAFSGQAWERASHPAPLETSVAQDAVLQAFAFAANQFIAASPPPSSPTVYHWRTIREAPGIPPATAAMTFPPDWRVVRRPDGEWVICLTLDEPVVPRISARMPENAKGVYRVSSALVLGAGDAESAATKASFCEAN